VLSLLLLLPLATLFLCPYAGPIYSIVLTIVHPDGTSILSLHTMHLVNLFALFNIILLINTYCINLDFLVFRNTTEVAKGGYEILGYNITKLVN
jgi:hypothetical protein